MADFTVHFISAAVLSGVTATVLLATGTATSGEALLCLAAGSVGGLLPDLDADKSSPLKFAFTLAGLFFAFIVLFSLAPRWSVAELLGAWLLVFLFVRVVLHRFFSLFTVHRGILHSIPASLLFGLAGLVFLTRGLGRPNEEGWLVALFLTGGSLFHLLLDEFYALNISALQSKGSLGTALKLYSRDWKATLSVYLLLALMIPLSPSPEELVVRFQKGDFLAKVMDRLWPRR